MMAKLGAREQRPESASLGLAVGPVLGRHRSWMAILLMGLVALAAIPPAHAASFRENVDALARAKDWRTRMAAATALGRLRDTRARRPLVTALNDIHYAVRAASIRALTRLGDPRGVVAIVDRLDDEEPFVRREARRALEHFPLDVCRDILLDTLRRHDASRARLGAAERLAESSAPDIVSAMVDVAGDRNEVGRFARSYLMALPEAPTVFREALDHPDYRVQKTAIQALAELGDGVSTEALVAKLDSKVPEVTLAAAAALRRLADHVDRRKYFVLARRADRFRRARALKVVGALGGQEASALLLNALDDPDVLIRGAAVAGLAAIGDVRAIPKLTEMRKLEENARIIALVKITLTQLKRAQAAASNP